MRERGGRGRQIQNILLGLLLLSSCIGDSDASPSRVPEDSPICLRLVDQDGVEVEEVDFGSLGSTEARRRARVFIENCDDERPLRIGESKIEAAGSFVLRGLERTARLIDAGGVREVEIIFGPPNESEPGEFEASWTIKAAEEERAVALRGRLVDCPTFYVAADGPWEDEEERMIVLSNRAPEAAAKIVMEERRIGEIERWDWEVSAAPSLRAGLKVEPRGNNLRFLPDKPGYYGINAVGVHREEGVLCLPEPRGSLGVHNSVGADVMAVLSWDEAEDGHPQAHPGYELHYRNRKGRWRSDPWDVFSENEQADWGIGGQVEMSHRAFLGGRWESVIHSEPASGEVVDLGAQLLSALAPGEERPLGVRAQVFVKGDEILDLRRAPSEGWRGWHIARIRWPLVEAVDQVHRDLWEVP